MRPSRTCVKKGEWARARTLTTAPVARPLLPLAQRRRFEGTACQFGSIFRRRFRNEPVGNVMKHHATRELFDYWNRLRGSRAAPERAELDLAALRGLIADMFMLKVDAAHLFPFVLSGTRINALACAEQKGCSFLDLWAPSDAQNVAAMLLRAMDASCPVLAHATATPEGWPAHDIEILFLPL